MFTAIVEDNGRKLERILYERNRDGGLHTIRKNDRTLLHVCVRRGRVDCAKVILAFASNLEKEKLSKKLQDIKQELHILKRDLEDNTKEINQLYQKRNKIKKASVLRTEEAFINLLRAKDKRGRTPLHFAASSMTFPIETLLDGRYGANLQSKRDLSVLNNKDINKLQEVRRELLDIRDENGRTALHFASFNGMPSNVKTLIRAGSNPYLRDQHDHTPLAVAKNAITRRAVTLTSSDLVGVDLERDDDDYDDDDTEDGLKTKTSVIRSLVLNDPSGIEAMLRTRMNIRSETCLHTAARECDVVLGNHSLTRLHTHSIHSFIHSFTLQVKH